MVALPAVLVTGISSGIGDAVGRRLRAAGCRVIGVDRVSAAVPACDAFLECELGTLADDSARDLQELGHRARAAIGPRRLQGLVHAAAIQVCGATEDLSAAQLIDVLRVNVAAPYAITRELLPELRSGKACVVHIGSVHARLSKAGFALYSTSKAALSGLTRALALELAPDVRVNEINPAATATPMLTAGFGDRWTPALQERLASAHPLQRIASADEIAAAVEFLLSPAASFVTAASLDVTGGIHARLHDPD